MNKNYKYIYIMILVMIITFILCFIFIKPKVLNFKNIEEFIYLENHIEEMDKFVIKTVTLLGEHCYLVDSNKGHSLLKNIEIKKETNMTITDSDMYFQIYFNNNKKISFKFEGENLEYKGKKYILKNNINVYKKEEFVPKIINDYMIIISENDEIECFE